MTNSDERDQEIADLRAQVERLTKMNALPKIEVTGGPSPSGGFKGGFFGLLGVAGAAFALIVGLMAANQCSKSIPAATIAPAAPATSAVSTPDVPSPAAENWAYRDVSDALHDTAIHTACTTSIDKVHLGAPYSDVDADLCLRRGARGTNVYITLNGDGQIICEIESCRIKIRYDKGELAHVTGEKPADDASNFLFLEPAKSLIASVKKSSVVVIELTLYENGSQTVSFNTAGLKWP